MFVDDNQDADVTARTTNLDQQLPHCDEHGPGIRRQGAIIVRISNEGNSNNRESIHEQTSGLVVVPFMHDVLDELHLCTTNNFRITRQSYHLFCSLVYVYR